jgi:hypothetical protein
MTKIKNCPFCGGEVILTPNKSPHCPKCLLVVKLGIWQQRVYPSEIQAVLDAAKELIHAKHIYFNRNVDKVCSAANALEEMERSE